MHLRDPWHTYIKTKKNRKRDVRVSFLCLPGCDQVCSFYELRPGDQIQQ